MEKFKKLVFGTLFGGLLMVAPLTTFAENDEVDAVDPNEIISVQENVSVPENVSLARMTLHFNHSANISFSNANRRVTATTRAYRGIHSTDSYSRARFESWGSGSVAYDSGRQWSINGGASTARSGWEINWLSYSRTAKTYYGN